MIEVGSYISEKYRIDGRIDNGHGGMSEVYRVWDDKLRKQWALKVAYRNGMMDDNKAIQGLIADKDALIDLSHEHLPRIVDVFETENSMMLVMDFIEGNDLQHWTSQNGARPEKDVIKWAKQICSVIDYLHGKGMIYRDLKPANLMLNPDTGNITLIDFGTARQFKNLQNTITLGTIGYCAPEQFSTSEDNIAKYVDARSDIYTIGATLHHLVTGIDPQVEQSFVKKKIRLINPKLSEGLEYIIDKCLKDGQAERYQSCRELMVDLERIGSLGQTIRKKLRNKITVFVITAFLAVAFAATSVFGYFAAENQLSADYDLIIQRASNTQMPQDERLALYREAITKKSYQPEAYLELIEMFISYGEANGNLSRNEVSFIREIENGMNIENRSGYSETLLPLSALEQRDKAAYEEVCYRIGIAFWYDYEVESERHSSAVSWFDRAKSSYPIAQTYVDIGKFELEIQRYQGQNRTEQMYESYQNLWTTLSTLKDNSVNLTDNDMKLMIWREIVNNASDKASYFLARVKKEDILSLLDGIVIDAVKLRNETSLEAIKNIIGFDPAEFSGDPEDNKGSLLFDINEARAKINSVKG